VWERRILLIDRWNGDHNVDMEYLEKDAPDRADEDPEVYGANSKL